MKSVQAVLDARERVKMPRIGLVIPVSKLSSGQGNTQLEMNAVKEFDPIGFATGVYAEDERSRILSEGHQRAERSSPRFHSCLTAPQCVVKVEQR